MPRDLKFSFAGPTAVYLKVLLSLLIVGAGVGAGAQSPPEESDWVVHTWQTDAGLPHNAVTALVQTRDRYLWLGTSNGLARFDGARFTIFRGVDHPGLKSNRILCLHEDARGALWIGTDGGGLACWREGNFTSLTTSEGLSSETVLCLGEDVAGALWAGTVWGLNRWMGQHVTTFFKTDGLPDDGVYALCQPSHAALVLATGKGLCEYRREGLRAYEPPASLLLPGVIHCLCEDRAGQVWLGGDQGLIRIPNGGTSRPAPALRLSSAKVRCLLERKQSEIWFGTSAGELCRVALEAKGPEAKSVWHFPAPVTALCEDAEGNLWVGTAGNGLHRVKRRQLDCVPLPEGLEESRIPALFEAPEGEPRLLAADRSVYRCENGRFTLLDRLPLPDGVSAQTLCATSGGGLWIGTLGDGLFEWSNGTLAQFSERNGLSDSAIEALLVEKEGGLWIGTRNGGLNYFKDRRVRRFHTPWGFSGNYACVLTQDRQTNLWIGTTGDGLFQFVDGRFVAYAERQGLPSGNIRALHADPEGSLWVGTTKGLCRIKAGRVAAFGGRKGLGDEAVLQLRSDDAGNLWVGSNSGIFRVRKAQLEACAAGQTDFLDPVPYGQEDGLPSLQCLSGAPFPASQVGRGEVWFWTTKGLVVARRHGRDWNSLPPVVILEHVVVENESAALGSPIRVAPGKENLQFEFTALSLTAPTKVRFRYHLEGFDRDWSEPNASRTARYPKVPPGKYRFRVVACNNDGIWNEMGASVAVVVLPFWWATAWFHLSVAVGVAAILGGLYRLRQTRRREIESLRLRIASDLHDDVGSSLWSITLLSRMLAKHGNLGSEERQDIDEINRIAVQTSNSIRDIIWLINPAFDSVQDLLLRTKDFAAAVLRGTEYRVQCPDTSRARKLPLDFRQNLFVLFKEALTNVARHAQATLVDVRIQEQDGQWQLTIQDNGIGFDPGASTAGNGLRNLCARARKLGASLEIRSQPGKGTTLVFSAALLGRPHFFRNKASEAV